MFRPTIHPNVSATVKRHDKSPRRVRIIKEEELKKTGLLYGITLGSWALTFGTDSKQV